ncbi:MAG: response regulator transcription factor [Myxococcaceae bacterium]|nr:response regulator transcription factor [Myxococcaceae bacterium]
MTTQLKVLIAEDHGLVRAGIRALLTQLGVPIAGEARDGNEALELIDQLHPDLVLMDLSLPGLNGLEAIRRALEKHPRLRIVVLSMHSDRQYVRQALVAGAVGYVLKSSDPEELEQALAAAERRELWLSPAIAQTVRDELVKGLKGGPESDLTPRQREVLQLIAEGHSTKQIAKRLNVSVKTVEAHRAQIMERLEIRHVAGLVRYAIRAGLVSGEE